MIGIVGGAFVAGLVGSPHCIGMCGGFASACSTDVRHGTAYHLGRMSTYATLGALAGTFGRLLPGPGWVATVVSGALVTVFALSLAGLIESPAPRFPGLAGLAARARAQGGLAGAWGLGAATALLPCGLVWAALGVPIAIGQAGLGALAMVLFGLGTTPLLAGASMGLQRVMTGRMWTRRALAVLVLAAGWWSVGMRSMAATNTPDEAPACHGQE